MANDSFARSLAVAALSQGGATYTAGQNIQISDQNVISATDTTYSNATTSAAGLESAADKTKLDSLVAVSGTNDGTNWSTITIDGTTKNIPSGGSSSGAVRYDEAQSLTESQCNQAWSNLQLGCSKTTASHIIFDTTGQTISSTSSDTIIYYPISPELTDSTFYKDTSYTIEYTYDGTSGSFTDSPTGSSAQFIFTVSGTPLRYVWIKGSTQVNIRLNSGYDVAKLTYFKVKETNAVTTYTPISSNLLPAATLTNLVDGAGSGSILLANGSQASGTNSVCLGMNSSAIGSASATLGNGGTAWGGYSVAIGGTVNSGADYGIAIGNGTYVSGTFARAIGSSDTFAYSQKTLVFGNGAKAVGFGTTALGNYNNIGTQHSATAGEVCAVNDLVWFNSKWYICIQAKTLSSTPSADIQNTDYFLPLGASDANHGAHLLELGNGTSSAASNALAIDWSGNAMFNGDIYVGCNSDSTGGTKLPRIPECPTTTDGTFVLKCTVASGVATYAWVAE